MITTSSFSRACFLLDVLVMVLVVGEEVRSMKGGVSAVRSTTASSEEEEEEPTDIGLLTNIELSKLDSNTPLLII